MKFVHDVRSISDNPPLYEILYGKISKSVQFHNHPFLLSEYVWIAPNI